jgi:hypothetical protein
VILKSVCKFLVGSYGLVFGYVVFVWKKPITCNFELRGFSVHSPQDMNSEHLVALGIFGLRVDVRFCFLAGIQQLLISFCLLKFLAISLGHCSSHSALTCFVDSLPLGSA